MQFQLSKLRLICLLVQWRGEKSWALKLRKKRTRDGTGHVLLCVPPCFVSTGNKCILLCAFSPIGANGLLNENNEELRMEHSIFSVPLSAAISDRKHAHRLRTSLAVSSFQTRSVGRRLVQPWWNLYQSKVLLLGFLSISMMSAFDKQKSWIKLFEMCLTDFGLFLDHGHSHKKYQ